MTNAHTSGILEFTKKQFHHGWSAACLGLVFGLALLIALNSISTYRWVSRPLAVEQSHSEMMRSPIAVKTAAFSSAAHHQAAWSLRRAVLINVVASLALLVALALLGLRRRV